jgi:SagB-type dehydrogenase family enzyme
MTKSTYSSTIITVLLIITFTLTFTPSTGLSQSGERNGFKSVIMLPQPERFGDVSVEEAIYSRRSVRSFRNEPLTLAQISQLVWSAQGVTDRGRGYRTAPSAGALFPLEIYIVIGNAQALAPGIYRYEPASHSLRLTVSGDQRGKLAESAYDQKQIKEAPVVMAIVADFDKTKPKYGPKAARFVHMEAGHAGQNICLQAVSLGLATVPVGGFYDVNTKEALHLPSPQDPLYLFPIGFPK